MNDARAVLTGKAAMSSSARSRNCAAIGQEERH